ncbi:MAG: hypothetical protein L6Q38_17780 [Nitrospira sp.]|nr:hypothetical protein [Nitrospira sp.]
MVRSSGFCGTRRPFFRATFLVWAWLVWLGPSPLSRAASDAAGEIVVTLRITANASASIGTSISDDCKLQFEGRAVFRPDPDTGHYGDAVEESYSMSASGGGHILTIESWTYDGRKPGPGTISLS